MTFLRNSTARLQPFAISPGKVYLCRPGQHSFFHGAIKWGFSHRYVDKIAQMFDSPVLIRGVRDGQRALHERLALILFESAIGRQLGANACCRPSSQAVSNVSMRALARVLRFKFAKTRRPAHRRNDPIALREACLRRPGWRLKWLRA